MPAWRVDSVGGEVKQYDVCAMYGTTSGFVEHIALFAVEEPAIVNSSACTLRLVHMGPPLETSSRKVDVVGTALLDQADVQPAERRQIKIFVDDRLLERNAQAGRLKRLSTLERIFGEYVIHPPYVEADENVPLWRFSCVGFVIRAYEEARIVLLNVDALPDVTLGTLKSAYPQMAGFLDRQEIRTSLGIGSGSQWPVALVGYVINSLNRDAATIRSDPYAPHRGDEFFPPQRPAGGTGGDFDTSD